MSEIINKEIWGKAVEEAGNTDHSENLPYVMYIYNKMKDDIDSAALEKTATISTVEQDEDLIHNWKQKNDYGSYRKLKDRHKGMVMQAVNMYRAANIPSTSLEAEAWTLFDDAVNNFQTGKDAKFSTYLNYQLRKMDRHTKKYQNVARIPEALSGKIGEYDRFVGDYTQKNGKQPTYQEIAKALEMKTKHVKQLNMSRRADVYESRGVNTEGIDQDERINWILVDLREELGPQEQMVYDHLIGHGGIKPIENKRDLAKKLNMSPGRISQITTDIAKKIQPHLKRKI
jgi:DNA-directed RNA polymerase sigma subunit (sigma70/sigma32)